MTRLSLFRSLLIVAGVLLLLYVPWLGDTYFYSKGEPREAVVALSMLESGNWILPLSNGVDLPYKPPLLAWLIAIGSCLFNHGQVNEFTSRLPSALAACAMLMAVWAAVRRHHDSRQAWFTVLICATCFEVFRAATACRVDMLLTGFMVCGILALVNMRHKPWMWVWAVLCLSGATLTKGPVGSLLPCLCAGLYLLLNRQNFWRVFLSLTAVCLLSFILPALWYWQAWKQGGQAFMNLALEENLGRLTGNMSYESHINPWYYNVTSMLAGLLPWAVPALIAAVCRPGREFIVEKLRTFRTLRGFSLLSVVCLLSVFIFYCIPSSKRSVYLLPCYPFAAYIITILLKEASTLLQRRVWVIFLAVVSLVAPIALVCIEVGLIHIRGVAPLRWWLWPVAFLPGILSMWWVTTRSSSTAGIADMLAFTLALVLAYNAAYMPAFLNARSDFAATEKLRNTVPPGETVTGVIPQDRLMRYYSINFYSKNHLLSAPTLEKTADDSWIITGETDSIPPGRRVVDTLTLRSADTRRAVILLSPVLKTNP